MVLVRDNAGPHPYRAKEQRVLSSAQMEEAAKFSHAASWAVWGSPDPDHRANFIDAENCDLVFPSVTDEELRDYVHCNYVFLGLNPGDASSRSSGNWRMFHAGTRSRDHFVAHACARSALWGSFMIDLFDVNESKSGVLMGRVEQYISKGEVLGLPEGHTQDQYDPERRVDLLVDLLDKMDARGARIVAFGKGPMRVLGPYLKRSGLDLRVVNHYSPANAHVRSAREYREEIHAAAFGA